MKPVEVTNTSRFFPGNLVMRNGIEKVVFPARLRLTNSGWTFEDYFLITSGSDLGIVVATYDAEKISYVLLNGGIGWTNDSFIKEVKT